MGQASAAGAETIHGRLIAAQGAAGTVAKTGRNKDQGYDYAEASAVIEEAQRALNDAGLAGWLEYGDPELREISSRGGNAGLFATVAATVVLIDAQGAEIRIPGFHGTGTDYPGDKAIYKAKTGAAKYAWAGVLGIPFGDDPEAGAAEDRAAGGPGTRASRSGDAPGFRSEKQSRMLAAVLKKKGGLSNDEVGLAVSFIGHTRTSKVISEIIEKLDEGSDPAGYAASILAAAEAAKAQAQAAEQDAAAEAPDPPAEEAEEEEEGAGEPPADAPSIADDPDAGKIGF